MENGISLADIAAVTDKNDDMFGGAGGGGMWIFALLILLLIGGGGGGLFGSGAANAVSQADLQRAVDLNSIQEGQAGINANVQRTAYENMVATKDAQLTNLQEIRDNGALISASGSNIINNLTAMSGMIQSCCCDVKQAILENRYLDAQNTAAINANTTAAMQKVLDTYQQDKIAALTSEVSDLKTQNMFCGIPRINPYGFGVYPYSTGCCSGQVSI